MAENNSVIVDLIKYPILVFSIVIGLIILKFSLGLEFGVVTEVTTDGLKFSEKSNEATLEAITELESKLNALDVRIVDIETIRPQKTQEQTDAFKANEFSAAQVVSDATAKIAELSIEIPGVDKKVISGWIWIGNYANQNWSKTTLSELNTGQLISINPDSMLVGTQYKVLSNLVIRDGLPPNNDEYYKAKKSLGVVPRSSIITLLQEPESIVREFANQYWAKVEYTIQANIRSSNDDDNPLIQLAN